MGLYTTLAVLAIAATFLVRRYDLYNREPPELLWSSAAWGAVVMWSMGWLEPWFIDDLVGRNDAVIVAIVAAGFEEFGKLLAVVCIALAAPKHFDDPMDGLVYGAMAGLGAAVEESVFFLDLFPPGGAWLPPSEVVRMAGHLVMGGIGSFGLGLWVCRHPWRRSVAIGGWATAVTIHFAFDWLVLTDAVEEGLRGLGTIAVMSVGLVAFGVAVVWGSSLSRAVFAPDSERGLWGWPFRRS